MRKGSKATSASSKRREDAPGPINPKKNGGQRKRFYFWARTERSAEDVDILSSPASPLSPLSPRSTSLPPSPSVDRPMGGFFARKDENGSPTDVKSPAAAESIRGDEEANGRFVLRGQRSLTEGDQVVGHQGRKSPPSDGRKSPSSPPTFWSSFQFQSLQAGSFNAGHGTGHAKDCNNKRKTKK